MSPSREYICVRKCHFGKGQTVDGKAPPRKIYNEGDREFFAEGERIPEGRLGAFFVPLDSLPPPTAVKDDGPVKFNGLRAPVDKDALEMQKQARSNKGKKKTAVNDF